MAPADGASGSEGGMPRVGAMLGRYTLGQVLGRGAMATVFRGRDTHLGREVAIKVMNLAIAARSESAVRFQREAQAVAAVKHPGIVEIFDFVPATDDEPSYIVSELITGPTLRELCARGRGRLLPEVAALVGAQIADALAVAHDKGVVHRDVKPDNVMIEPVGSGSRVVLADFGVAQVTGLESMTATGALVGSPAYMSPEQARGHDTGPAADIWALGVLLYEVSTGGLPFPGRDPLAVVVAIARGMFKRPSQISAYVGGALEAVIMRCLQNDPALRYPNAAALAADLRAFAAAAGLNDERALVRRCLDDAEGLEAELRPRMANLALESARRHVRRAEFARALAEIGRATAYVPRHAGAEALLASLSVRRRWVRVAAVIAVAGVIAAVGWTGRRMWRRPQTVSISVPAPAPMAVTAIESPKPITPPPLPAPLATAEPAKRPNKVTRRPVARPEAPGASAAASPETVSPPVAAVPAAAPAPSPPAEPAPPQPLGQITLRSSNGLCYPVIGDAKPTESVRTFTDLPPGTYKVFCPRDKNGPWLVVGDVVLRPGAMYADRAIVFVDKDKPAFKKVQ